WLAAMVQVPAAMALTVEPLMVQIVGVLLVKATARPEVAVALTVVVPPTLTVVGLKLTGPMVWAAWLTCSWTVALALLYCVVLVGTKLTFRVWRPPLSTVPEAGV